MAERAADGAAVAHRAIGDLGSDSPHGAAGHVGGAAVLDIGMGDEGAQHELVAGDLCALELGKARNVDDQLRLHQPQIEHRAERLAAGDDLCRSAARGQHRESRIEVARALVSEGRRFHAALLSAARAASTAATIRCGVIGDCISSTPSGRSASLTALAIAAGGAIAPPSPMPFTPNCV
ncbi:hypothetical protein ABIA07_001931 [Bradyrhizobium yuanmingense]